MTQKVWIFFVLLHIKFGYNWPCSFREEVILNCGRMRKDDNDGQRKMDPFHPISSLQAFGSGELKTKQKNDNNQELQRLN